MSEPIAGRELDREVATRVMGWTLGEPEYVMGYLGHGGSTMRLWKGPGIPTAKGFLPSEEWSPSTDIAAAWEVVETMCKREDVVYFTVERFGPSEYEDEPYRAFCNKISAVAKTAPLAICLAALAAVGETPR